MDTQHNPSGATLSSPQDPPISIAPPPDDETAHSTFLKVARTGTISSSSMKINTAVPMQRQLSTAQEWKITLDRAVKGIVSIKYTTLRAFDRDSEGSFMATGFIVDKKRGIILSNRHVVRPGPTTSTALFPNYEEVSLTTLWFDPVHDFGFFKFDPSTVKFAEIEEIELYPQGAKVGLDIKVCGNDDGEQRSILSSVLARLDRNAPYADDFNTFYFQAASATSGGSSGSPVLDIAGRAVALNSGGSSVSASSFYLPLDRVVRALKLIQDGKPVPRGTLQVEFVHVSFAELRKMGLAVELEKERRQRNKDSTGLLYARNILPEGPGFKAGMIGGDILLECSHRVFGRKMIDTFDDFWQIVDDVVGEDIEVLILRGTERKTLTVKIQDLNEIIPHSLLEIGRAIIHPLSYQTARLYHWPCKGLFVARTGMLQWSLNSPFLITSVEGKAVDTLDAFLSIIRSIPDYKPTTFKYRPLGGWEEHMAVFDMDHHFFSTILFQRIGGGWQRTPLPPPPVPKDVETKALDIGGETWIEKLGQTLVSVRFRLPFSMTVCPRRSLLM
jgi:pro-apoptotic serine protease NMA111